MYNGTFPISKGTTKIFFFGQGVRQPIQQTSGRNSSFLDQPCTLKIGMYISNFSILTPEQTKHNKLGNPISVRHLLNKSHDDAIHSISSFFKISRTVEVNEPYLFPTPQNPCNEKELTPIQTSISTESSELEDLEQLNIQDGMNFRNQFVSKFDWTDSNLELDARQAVETLLVEFFDTFARHHFDIGITTEFRVQLTPLDKKPLRARAF